MDFSIASYSFHRLLEAGKQDMFSSITDCNALGCGSGVSRSMACISTRMVPRR